MLIKVDWISFSVPMDVTKMEDERDAPAQVVLSLENLHLDLPSWLGLEQDYTVGNGRAPYRTSWARHDDGLRIFTHPSLPHALIEISGRGCDTLASIGSLYDVLKAVTGRITRLDIACDILTDTKPLDFCSHGYSAKFKAHSYVTSESGSTYYVGAKTSDRYARVYRYNEPHERHHLLRVEYVIKAENAKNAAHAIGEYGLRAVAATLGETFGWLSDEWRLTDERAELEVYRPDRREGKTLFWLADTIAPLLARLANASVIDLETWLNEHVRPKIKN